MTTPQPQTAIPTSQPVGQNTGQSNPFALSQVMTAIQGKVQSNNALMTQRNLLLKHLYDQPLTPDEQQQLDPTFLKAVQTNDRGQIDMSLRLLSDEVAGRTNTLDQSVNYLVNAYNQQQQQVEAQRKDAIDTVLNFASTYKENAGPALRALYGDAYIQQLKDMGIDVEALSKVAPGIGGTTTPSAVVLGNPTGTSNFGLPLYDTQKSNPGVNRPNRNSNPGNIKASDWSVKLPGVIGVESNPASDGGNFLIFDSPQSGMAAIGALLQQGKSYKGVTAEKAIRAYSGGGYGADAVGLDPSQDFQSQIASSDVLDGVVSSIAQREGFTAGTSGVSSDISAQVDAIMNGTLPPPNPAASRSSKATQSLFAELSRRGFDTGKAYLEYQKALKTVQSLSSSQMVRFFGLATSVQNTITEVGSLADKMRLSGIPALNKAQLELLIQTQGNTPSGQLASQYLAAVNTLKEEFANLAQGGFAPTEAAWSLANSQINANYGVDQLKASLDEVNRLIGFRVNAIKDQSPLSTGAGGTNADDLLSQYGVGGGTQTPTPTATPPSQVGPVRGFFQSIPGIGGLFK
jgi:hypothetical protein